MQRNREQQNFYENSTELYKAVMDENENKVFKLLQCERCFSEEDLNESFLRAVNTNNLTIIEYFLSTGRINFKNLNRSLGFGGILAEAVANPDIDTIGLLISTGKIEPGYYNPDYADTQTALMTAAEIGATEIAKMLLLTKESKPEFVNRNGESALSIAEKNGSVEIAQMIRDELRIERL